VAFKLPHPTLYISFPPRPFAYRSPGLIVHLSSWNAERHQPWGKNFQYLLLYSSIHRHFWTRSRHFAVLHTHTKGHKMSQQTTCALDQAGTSSKCQQTRDSGESLSVTLNVLACKCFLDLDLIDVMVLRHHLNTTFDINQ